MFQIDLGGAFIKVSLIHPQSQPELIFHNCDFAGHIPAAVNTKKPTYLGGESFTRQCSARHDDARRIDLHRDVGFSRHGMSTIDNIVESAFQPFGGNITGVALGCQYLRHRYRCD